MAAVSDLARAADDAADDAHRRGSESDFGWWASSLSLARGLTVEELDAIAALVDEAPEPMLPCQEDPWASVDDPWTNERRRR